MKRAKQRYSKVPSSRRMLRVLRQLRSASMMSATNFLLVADSLRAVRASLSRLAESAK